MDPDKNHQITRRSRTRHLATTMPSSWILVIYLGRTIATRCHYQPYTTWFLEPWRLFLGTRRRRRRRLTRGKIQLRIHCFLFNETFDYLVGRFSVRYKKNRCLTYCVVRKSFVSRSWELVSLAALWNVGWGWNEVREFHTSGRNYDAISLRGLLQVMLRIVL